MQTYVKQEWAWEPNPCPDGVHGQGAPLLFLFNRGHHFCCNLRALVAAPAAVGRSESTVLIEANKKHESAFREKCQVSQTDPADGTLD